MLVNFPQKTKLIAFALSALGAGASVQAADKSGQQLAALQPPQQVTNRKSINGARPDIAALRYYAMRGEQDRAQAEIERLTRLYPAWRQPENIFAEDDDIEQPLWKLLAQGRLKELHEKIEQMREEFGDFEPSEELKTGIEERRRRDLIAAEWKAENWQAVIDLSDEFPGLLAGRDVELIWFVAEAFARLERPKDAYQAFLAAIAASTTEHERLATLERGASLLIASEAIKLLAVSNAQLEDPQTRTDVEDAIVRGALIRSAELGEDLPSDIKRRMDRFAARARKGAHQQDIMLLAWSNFGQRRWQEARAWFETANTISTDFKAVEGAIMSAKRMGDIDMAREMARKFRDATAEIGALYINVEAPPLLEAKPVVFAPRDLTDYAAKTVELSSGEGAEALGWYAFNVGQLQTARAWFSKAVLWEETDTAAFGLALSASRMKDRAAFNSAVTLYGAKYKRVAELVFDAALSRSKTVRVNRRSSNRVGGGRLRLRIVKLYKAKRYNECLQLSRKLRQYGPLRADDHQMRGWCLLGVKRPAEAERAFASAVRLGGRGRTPSAYGQALSALRNGKTNDALSIANANALTPRQRRIVDIELLTQRARSAFAQRDYAASIYALNERSKLASEPRDLTLMRGWAHFHSGHYHGARDVFAMLDQQLSTSETRRGFASAKSKIRKTFSNDH